MKDILLVDDSMLINISVDTILKHHFKNLNIYHACNLLEAESILQTKKNIGIVLSETYFNGRYEYDKLKELADKYKTHKVGIITTQAQTPIDDNFIFKHIKPVNYKIIIKTLEKYI